MTDGPARKPMITVLSPVYGCRDCIETLIDRTSKMFDESQFDWEFILVDDRGPDEPWDLVCKLSEIYPNVRGIRLARNHGQHLAIWAGLAAARGDWLAVVDCDLQDDPEVIPKLYDRAIETKADAVVVDRGTWRDSYHRRLASRAFYRVFRFLSGFDFRNSGNFGLYSRQMVNTLLKFHEQEVFLPIMVMLTGLKVSTYEYTRSGRLAGKSSYSFLRLLRLAGSIIVRFSDRPLKINVMMGIAISAIALVSALVLVVAWLLGAISVPGWTSTIVTLWFITGLIMATLGVHGLYLSRVFSEVKNRPRIIVEKTTFPESE